MSETKRVVLIEPGDILLVGNLGENCCDSDILEPLLSWAEAIDIRIAMFPGPIDVDALKAADRA